MPHEINMQGMPLELGDLVVHDSRPSHDEVIEAHDPEGTHLPDGAQTISIEVLSPDLEVAETNPELEESQDLPDGTDIVVMQQENGEAPEAIAAIDFGDLPGAPKGTKDPEPAAEKEKEDESDAEDVLEAKDKKKDKWDWKSHGFGEFTVWVKERFDSVPKHSGYSLAGLERAYAYLERLHSEISKAMRADLDGDLEAEIIASIHEKIEDGLEQLEQRIDKVKQSKKKSAEELQEGIVKEAQKIFGVQNGVAIVVPLFISAIARVLVNGMISSGRDIEDSYAKLTKKYKLTDREKIELIQLLQDMGLPMIRDRSLLPEDGLDTRSDDNFDFGANYQA